HPGLYTHPPLAASRNQSAAHHTFLPNSLLQLQEATMASVGFGSTMAPVAPASSSAAGRKRPQRSVLLAAPAATRAGRAPAAKEETSLAEFIFGKIFKKDQLVETDPLLNKVDGAPASKVRGGTTSGRGTTSGAKKPATSDDGGSGGGGFSLGGLFDRKG
ncbi:unnamed protein product, partial [Urochloa humidicola]